MNKIRTFLQQAKDRESADLSGNYPGDVNGHLSPVPREYAIQTYLSTSEKNKFSVREAYGKPTTKTDISLAVSLWK